MSLDPFSSALSLLARTTARVSGGAGGCEVTAARHPDEKLVSSTRSNGTTTRSLPKRMSIKSTSVLATASCSAALSPLPVSASAATKAPPAALPRESPTPPAETTNPSTRDSRYGARSTPSPAMSVARAGKQFPGAAHAAATFCVSGIARSSFAYAGTAVSGDKEMSSSPRSVCTSAANAAERTRSIFSAACFKRTATIVVTLVRARVMCSPVWVESPIGLSSPSLVSASHREARVRCAAARRNGIASIAASRTHDPTSPRLSMQ
mmetsp:Transcript_4713/g.17425  ORF Transcript_4713/g.17425 Transcript_4713/m.17425 type:complete len:265 (+) Transcript_4713:509-1303(+)